MTLPIRQLIHHTPLPIPRCNHTNTLTQQKQSNCMVDNNKMKGGRLLGRKVKLAIVMDMG